jgi:hypothetical membrane protein
VGRLLENLAGRQRAVGLLASCGIIGPALFGISVGIANFYRPDHDPISQLVSDLGRGSTTYASLMNIGGFIISGILTILFGFAIFLAVAPKGWRRTGALLVSLGGVGMIGAGIFSNDPSSRVLFNSAVGHQIFTIVVMGGAVFGPILLAGAFQRNPQWRGYRTFSLTVALVIAFFVSVMFIDYLRVWQGAVERAFAGLMFLWMQAMAIRLTVLSLRARARAQVLERAAETTFASPKPAPAMPRRFRLL